VLQKIIDKDVYHDLSDYLDQSVRLEGIAIYHGVQDEVPVEMARSFSDALTDSGVEHTYAEVEAGHCGPSWDYSPLLKFMSETLGQ
jgi:predicted esterase